MGNLIMPLSKTPFEEIDCDQLEEACKCIGIWLAMHGYITNKASNDMQNFLKGLLRQDVKFEYHRRNIPYFEPDRHESFRLFFITSKKKDDVHYELCIARLCKKAKAWWHVPCDDGYVILADSTCTKQLEALRLLMEEKDEHALISDIYFYVFDTHIHYQVLQSLRDLTIIRTSRDRLLYVNDYKILLALNSARSSLPRHVFINELLEKIIQYDNQYNSFYLETLRSYFNNRHDYEKMAEELHIKKNSVFYRMNRLCDVFGVDLDDALQMSGLYYSLLIKDGKL